MRKHLSIIGIIFTVSLCNIYAQTISGPTELDQAEEGIYTIVDAYSGATYSWEATGDRTINSISTSMLKVEWDSAGVYYVKLLDVTYSSYVKDVLEIIVGNPPKIEYSYDAAGNRISRIVVILPEGSKKSIKSDVELIEEIEEEQKEFGSSSFKVYPNPTTQHLIVSLDEKYLEYPMRTIILLDIQGKTLKTIQPTENLTQVDLSEFPSGIYFLKLLYGNHSKECKIIKQ